MGLRAKIIMAAVNFLCLMVTLVYPNNATAIALLPSWITAGEWLYLRIASPLKIKKKSDGLIIAFFVFLVACATLSMCIGFVCNYIDHPTLLDAQVENIRPYFALKESVVFPFDFKIDYAAFEIFVLAIFGVYFISDIILTAYNELNPPKKNKRKMTQTPSEIINTVIK